jgi:hypothetical protein
MFWLTKESELAVRVTASSKGSVEFIIEAFTFVKVVCNSDWIVKAVGGYTVASGTSQDRAAITKNKGAF